MATRSISKASNYESFSFADDTLPTTSDSFDKLIQSQIKVLRSLDLQFEKYFKLELNRLNAKWDMSGEVLDDAAEKATEHHDNSMERNPFAIQFPNHTIKPSSTSKTQDLWFGALARRSVIVDSLNSTDSMLETIKRQNEELVDCEVFVNQKPHSEEEELKSENELLRKQNRLMQIETEQLLYDYGKVMIEEDAKQNDEKNWEIFQRTFFLTHAAPCVHCTDSDKQTTARESKRENFFPTYGIDGELTEQISTKEKVKMVKHGDTRSNSVANSTSGNSNAAKHGKSKALSLTREEIIRIGKANGAGKREVTKAVDFASTSRDECTGETSTQRETSRTAGSSSSQKNQILSYQTRVDETEEKDVHGIDNIETKYDEEDKGQKTSIQQSYNALPCSIQQDDSSGREYISLDSVPPTSVASTLYNNYKLLLINIAERLLSGEAALLKIWAIQQFHVDDVESAFKVLVQLDKKRIINASNLDELKTFFESITRFDLSYIIDAFLLGDYQLLRYSPPARKHVATMNRVLHLRQGASSEYQSLPTNTGSHPSPNALITPQQLVNQATSSSPTSTSLTTQKNPNDNDSENVVRRPGSVRNATGSSFKDSPTVQNSKFAFPKFTASEKVTVAVADGPTTREIPNRTSNSLKTSNGATKIAQPVSTNAPYPHSAHEEDGIEWLCNHYKRHCYVKFDCCDKFWPCHRCHNNQSNCGKKKLKSRDTKMVKCARCNEEQDFAEFCRKCHTKFASYYCGVCKHLTGTDDHPYHCPKCTICRIHGDRSFHCDTCGVCLDVQLRGNHRCREGSAHDGCCICLEDAFTGCQILPCSHKVHKECAAQMIRSGITRCPICRESFAHKLERRPMNSRKYSRK